MTANNAPTTSAAPAPMALRDLIVGGWVSQAVYVAAKLGLADLVEDGPKSPAELAEATGTRADRLHRVLRMLASIGVFVENEDGRFALTPLAEGLRSRAPVSWRAFAIFCGENWHWRAWGELLHSVRTGEPAFEHTFGTSLFDYLSGNPEAAQVFDTAMTSSGALQNRAVVSAYDFSAGTIVDVGGGEGALLAAILARNPDARGVLFDLPHAAEGAAGLLAAAGLAQRCEVVPGSFFEQVPTGGDVYILKRIIHDWNDERSREILARCRTAIPETGRLLLIEHVLAPGNAPSWAKLLDLEMLVMTSGGRERSEEEFRILLASVGFVLQRVIPTAGPICIIEAIPHGA